MSETCYVTEVRLLTALEPLSPRAMAAKAVDTVSKARFSFASIPWPFLPQVPYTVANATTTQKEVGCINNNVINNGVRQRRLVAASAVAAANVAAVVAPQKLQNKSAPSTPAPWPALMFLVLEGLRSKIAKSVLGMAVGSALAMLVCEIVTCLASLMVANKVPPGLLFMMAALGLLGYVAMQAINHDSASMSRRKTTLALLKR